MATGASQEPLFTAFSTAHLEGAARLSREAGWPHRVEDWALTLSVSTGTAALDGDEVVGTALCSTFGEVATLNMIVVDARKRGKGLGRALTEEAIKAAGTREMRLVATSDGLPLYERLGFRAVGEVAQHQGIARAAAPGLEIEWVDNPDIASMAALDRVASGMERALLLRKIADMGRVLRTDGGFAMLRPFGRGEVLGPVVARDAETARALIAAAATRCEGRFLRIDFPKALGFSDFAEELGLAHVGGGVNMVRAPRSAPLPDSDHRTFALAAHALG